MNETKSTCGSCGQIYPTNEGKISKDSEHHASFVCASCASKKIYKIAFTFSTNRELTDSECTNLMDALLLQIEDPTDYEQNPEKYITSNIDYEMEEVK